MKKIIPTILLFILASCAGMMTKHRMRAADRKLLDTRRLQSEGRWEEAAIMAEKLRSSVAEPVLNRPLRTGTNGVEVDLRPLFAAWENGPLHELTAALRAQDDQRSARALASLRQQCTNCHTVFGRSDIRISEWKHP